MTPQSRFSKQFAALFLLAGFALFGGPPTSAQNLPAPDILANYVLANVRFDDGSSAMGTFTYDFTTGAAMSVNVLTGGGIYNNSSSYPTHITPTSFDGNYDTQQVSYNFAFLLDKPLTPTSGSSITLDHSQSYLIVDQTGGGGSIATTYVTSGRVDLVPAAVPEAPATVSLGLGLMALSGLVFCMRRRRCR